MWWKFWFTISHQLIITYAKKINALPQNFFASEESAVLQRDKTAKCYDKNRMVMHSEVFVVY